jgi:flagellar hook-basal body complex protein FliE
MNCTQLTQQADLIASTFSKQDLAKVVVALKSSSHSLQHAVEVLDTINACQGYTLDQAWEEVLTGETRVMAVNDD